MLSSLDTDREEEPKNATFLLLAGVLAQKRLTIFESQTWLHEDYIEHNLTGSVGVVSVSPPDGS